MSKHRVIVEAVLSGKSQTEVARLYGISQPRVSQLVAAWRAGGWDALEPKSRRPRSKPNATSPDVVTRILALRAELIADGSDAEVLLWVDDHSRYLISATAHARVTGPIVVATFRAACDAHGTPQSTLTDNGFVFTTRFCGGPNSFEVLLANLGVAQKNGTPNHPQTQGKVERLNATLKKWLKARPRATTAADLQKLLDQFTHHYNHRRKHRSLKRRDPADVYAAHAKATPDRDTGEILRELTINPNKDSQPRGVKPGPRPGHRTGGMPKGYKYPKK